MNTTPSSKVWRLAAPFIALSFGCSSAPVRGPEDTHSPVTAEVVAVRAADSPIVDGRAGDAAWSAAAETIVAMEGSAGPRSCRVKAAVHRGTLFLLAEWEDATEDREHKPWVRNEAGAWKTGPEREDVLAVAFPMEGEFTGNMESPLDATWDVWHWKSLRSDPAGHAMDRVHRMSRKDPGGKRAEQRLPDGSSVFIARPEDAGVSVTEEFPPPAEGTRAARYGARRPDGSAAGVAARGTWTKGRWTVEMARALSTGQADDRDFAGLDSVPFSLAILDRAEDEEHAVSGVLLLRFPADGPR